MKIIKEGILAFTRDNHIISFDTREEYDRCDFKELNINHIFATPGDMVTRFREMDDAIDKLESKRLEQKSLC